MDKSHSNNGEQEPLELVSSCPAPSEEPQRKSTCNMKVATPAIDMPCVATKNGKTPVTNVSAEHIQYSQRSPSSKRLHNTNLLVIMWVKQSTIVVKVPVMNLLPKRVLHQLQNRTFPDLVM